MAHSTDHYSVSPEQEALLHSLIRWMQAPTWEDSRRWLEAHPELLGAEAEALLVKMAAAAREAGDRERARVFEMHLAVLRGEGAEANNEFRMADGE